MIYIGVDPGATGGIAWIIEGIAVASKTPETLHDIAELFGNFHEPCFCFCEQVGPNRQAAKGERRQGASTMFAFGRNFGRVEMAIAMGRIPFQYVMPSKWQSMYGLLRRQDETDTEKKNRHKAEAQRLFPSLKVTHAIADALLIAEYCRRVKSGELERAST